MWAAAPRTVHGGASLVLLGTLLVVLLGVANAHRQSRPPGASSATAPFAQAALGSEAHVRWAPVVRKKRAITQSARNNALVARNAVILLCSNVLQTRTRTTIDSKKKIDSVGLDCHRLLAFVLLSCSKKETGCCKQNKIDYVGLDCHRLRFKFNCWARVTLCGSWIVVDGDR